MIILIIHVPIYAPIHVHLFLNYMAILGAIGLGNCY